LIYNSGTVKRSSATDTVNVSVAGKAELRLIVSPTADGDGWDHADWAGARLLPASGCSYSLSPATQTFTSGGGAGQVSIRTSATCAWSATSNATWLTLTGQNGTGNGTVSFSVAPLTGTTPRTGKITIQGQTFTVTQQPPTSCTYTISPTSLSLTASGGSASMNITTGSGCAWKATTSVGWLTLSAVSGTGSGSFTFTAPAYTAATPRTGTLTVQGQVFAVTQQGAGTPPPNEVYLSDIAWIASTNGWGPAERDRSNGDRAAGDGKPLTLKAVKYAKGVGVHAHSEIKVALNGAHTAFVSDIGVDDGAGPAASVIFRVYGDNELLYSSGTLTRSSPTKRIDVDVTGKSRLRLVVSPTADGNGSDHANWAGARLVSGSTCSYSVSPTSATFNSGGGAGQVDVTAGPKCAWRMTSNASWLDVVVGTGSGNGPAVFTVAPHTGTTARTGTLTINGKVVTITQQPSSSCDYALSPVSKSFTALGGTGIVSVTTPPACSWTATSDVSWIEVDAAAGQGAASIPYTVAPNPGGPSRTGSITVGTGTLVVTQQGAALAVPVISDFTPRIGKPGTPLVITGANLSHATAKLNNTTLTVSSSTSGSITTVVPEFAGSGHIKVTTPNGSATSAADFIVAPGNATAASVEDAGRMAVGGRAMVTISTPNKIGLVLFDGTAGQRLRLTVTPGPAAVVTIYRPNGVVLTSKEVGIVTTTIEVPPLATGGTYVIGVDPNNNATGTTKLALF
jgi:hypothetical protein